MNVTQVYQAVNTATNEALGKTGLVAEDLSNIVEVGQAIFNANAVDNYVKALVDHIGKVIFVNRVYSGQMPKILMDGWEFGSVLEKVRGGLPEAEENESWELVDGASYDPNIFKKPSVTAKFYNKKVTFEIDVSITDLQVKESFSGVAQLNSFVSMLFTNVHNSLTLKVEALAHRLVSSFIGDTIYADYDAKGISNRASTSGVKAVNLLYLYTQETGDTSVTASNALVSPEFMRYASKVIRQYATRMGSMSTLFNLGATPKFTPRDYLRITLHGDFDASAHSYLYADTFHKDEVKLPDADVVSYWQGSGTSFAFADTSKINVTTGNSHAVEQGGIIGIMYDRDSMIIKDPDERVTTQRNGKAEFVNYFYKFDSSYFQDGDENFVVFFIA